MLTLGYTSAFLSREPKSLLDEMWSVILEPHRGAAAVVAVGFWTVAIFGYALLVYPDLPKEFGGGRRPIVRLVVNDAAALQSEGGIHVSIDNSTGLVLLVLETADRYVVTASRPLLGKSPAKSTAIRKDLVRAVIYEGAEP
jgi:hypothetical protein